ncbi:MAG TPA: N-acetylmuramoyl-L-alanine amidase [Thermoanaerobaculia bacterium]|nr:N-acetylmuramoyl-L-alanine amidase [Thermoanaerobaculia bacterium]
MKNRRLWISLLVCLLPVLVRAQMGQMQRAEPPATPPPPVTTPGRVPTVTLDGRDLPVPVAINPAGPMFGLGPMIQALGGDLVEDPAGESATLRVGETDVVMGVGSSVITVGDNIVSLSQPVIQAGGGVQVPLEFLQKTWGDLAGYSFEWRPQETRLVVARRGAREVGVAVDVVHLQGMTTVVLQFSEPPRYRINQQSGSVEVQMLGDRLSQPAQPPLVRDPLVQSVGVAPELIRMQMAPGLAVESYTLENPYRLVFDVHQPTSVAAEGSPALPPREARSGIRTIVIDPGHGGTETGAIGPSGIAEKELTLTLARELASRLQQRLPVRAILTRNDDSTLPLDTRPAVANQNKADLFISVHLNSSLGSGAHGAETYFLSPQASDERAASSAEAENRPAPGSTTTPGSAPDAQPQDLEDLQVILWDLAQSHHMAESQRFANLVQSELNTALQIRDRGVKQAPFRVLIGADMPAVLVELGFLSNPEEEAKLQDATHRAGLIDALVRAVARYKGAVEGKDPAQLLGNAAPAPSPTPTPAPATPAPEGTNNR